MSYFIVKQICILPPESFQKTAPWSSDSTIAEWLQSRVMELVYTTTDFASFAQELGCIGPPFSWNLERRRQIRAELDAAFFHLYLGSQEDWIATASKELREWFPTPRDVIPYIMESFPIVKDTDIKEYGRYRTCDAILTEYDRMATAIATGVPYESTLSPKPGQQLEAAATQHGKISRSKLYIIFVLNLFTARPEIENRTFRHLINLINIIFTNPEKFLSYRVSPANDVHQHIDAVHALIQRERESISDLDLVVQAIISENAIETGAILKRGSGFERFRATHPSTESAMWLVQEILRIEDRDRQLGGGEDLMESSLIAGDVDMPSQTQEEQAVIPSVNNLLIKG